MENWEIMLARMTGILQRTAILVAHRSADRVMGRQAEFTTSAEHLLEAVEAPILEASLLAQDVHRLIRNHPARTAAGRTLVAQIDHLLSGVAEYYHNVDWLPLVPLTSLCTSETFWVAYKAMQLDRMGIPPAPVSLGLGSDFDILDIRGPLVTAYSAAGPTGITFIAPFCPEAFDYRCRFLSQSGQVDPLPIQHRPMFVSVAIIPILAFFSHFGPQAYLDFLRFFHAHGRPGVYSYVQKVEGSVYCFLNDNSGPWITPVL